MSYRTQLLRAHRLPSDEEVLRGRALLLLPRDRELIEAVLIRGQSTRSVARLTGLPQRTIRWRVARLAKRLKSRSFLNAARALPDMSPQDAMIARLRYCAGATQPMICKWVSMTRHELRRRLERIHSQIQTITRLRKQGALQRVDGRADGMVPVEDVLAKIGVQLSDKEGWS